MLERENVPATFFVLGRNVAGREELLRRMLADGDMIGNHTYTHVDLSKASGAARAQIDRTQAAIEAATGFKPCLLRPPYGRTSAKLLGALSRRKLTSTLWSVNPQDFLRPGTAKIKQRVLAGVRPGSIVLDPRRRRGSQPNAGGDPRDHQGPESPRLRARDRDGPARPARQLNVTLTALALLILTEQVATLEAWPATGAWTAEQPPPIVTVAVFGPVAVTVT